MSLNGPAQTSHMRLHGQLQIHSECRHNTQQIGEFDTGKIRIHSKYGHTDWMQRKYTINWRF